MEAVMTLYGWDGSHYDWDRGPMDLAAARADGIEFFTHKATEGRTYTDPQFAYGIARAFNAGMPLIGAYCVNHQGDQRPQVDHFISVLDAQAPFWRDRPFLVQLDCERWSDKDGVYAYEPSLSEIHAWCDYFTQRTGGRLIPVVYAPKWVYGDSLRGLRYPLWASNYGSNPAVPYRQAYPGDGSSRWAAYSGITPAILQFGSTTTIGTQNICDANAFRGTVDQLKAMIKGDEGVDQYHEDAILYTDNRIAAFIEGWDEVQGTDVAGQGKGATVFPVKALKQLLADVEELKARPVAPPAEVDIPALVAALRPELEAAADRAVRKALGSLDEEGATGA